MLSGLPEASLIPNNKVQGHSGSAGQAQRTLEPRSFHTPLVPACRDKRESGLFDFGLRIFDFGSA